MVHDLDHHSVDAVIGAAGLPGRGAVCYAHDAEVDESDTKNRMYFVSSSNDPMIIGMIVNVVYCERCIK